MCNVGFAADVSSSNENNHEGLLTRSQLQDSLCNNNNSDTKESCLDGKYLGATTTTATLEETLPNIALYDTAQLPNQLTPAIPTDSVGTGEHIIMPDNSTLRSQQYDFSANASIRQDLIQCELPDNSVSNSLELKHTNQNVDCSIPPIIVAEQSVTYSMEPFMNTEEGIKIIEENNLQPPILTELTNVYISLSPEVGECNDLADVTDVCAVQGSSHNTTYPRRAARRSARKK